MDQDYILPISSNANMVPKKKSPYYGSLKQIANCILVDTTSLDGSNNDTGIVTSSSQYAPTDMVTGIREVYWISSTNISIKIHGIDTNGAYREWSRYYNGDTWTDWEKPALSSVLGSPSSASAVTGNDAFSKINSLNSNLTNLIKVVHSTGSTNNEGRYEIPSTDITGTIIGVICTAPTFGSVRYFANYNGVPKLCYMYDANTNAVLANTQVTVDVIMI